MNKNDLNLFKGKKVLITGGTGSFGKTICKHFLNQEDIQLRILSRDEKKQDECRPDFSVVFEKEMTARSKKRLPIMSKSLMRG